MNEVTGKIQLVSKEPVLKVPVPEEPVLKAQVQKIATDFDWQAYTQLYEDLRDLKTESAAYEHWITYGKREGRVASSVGICRKFGVAPGALLQRFNWQHYMALNADLNGHFTNEWQALFHYCQFGIRENREYARRSVPQSLIESFDWEFYLWYNKDIEGIDSEAAALNHWKTEGQQQGRLFSPVSFYKQQGVDITQLPEDFNAEEYVVLYPDLKDEGITAKWHAVAHFLKQPNLEDEVYSFDTLGLLLVAAGEYVEAIAAFEKGLKFSANPMVVCMNLAKALVQAKCWKRAVAMYRRVVDAGEVDDWTLYDFNRGLLRLIEAEIEVVVEDSKGAAADFCGDAERYQTCLRAGKFDAGGECWRDFRVGFDTLLDRQMAASVELASLRQVYQTIDSAFNFSEFIAFPRYVDPVVSIIIPVYNKVDYTIRCLSSLVKNVSNELVMEVIVVNDCSTDETREYLEEIQGLVLVNNAVNQGFIHSCNAGADSAKGEYLYFLNNDTEVLPDAIESLVEVLEANDGVGVVGSKLVYPSGALQEAGGVIWQDASGWNYGRNQNPHDPKYNFMRSVDYCSGASLLVRRESFERLQGFETSFAPAYYEDTDLCFAMRHRLDLDVVYQPKSVVVHYEGVSSGTATTSGIKRYQVVNAEKFQEKWAAELALYPRNERGVEDAHRAARRFQGQKTILVIDSYLPCYDKESGSRRLFQILKIFKALKYHVIFLPTDMRATEPYVSELQAMQIEVLYTCDGYGELPEAQLRERLPWVDVAWVCRPDLMERYLPVIRENAGIKVIYDTIDLHYLRMKRELELGLMSATDEQALGWVDMQALELKMAMRADVTLTVTPTEQEILQRQGIRSVEVVPNIHFPYEGDRPGFDQRSGLLFIGGYNHPPNVDGVEWLCNEIMPMVWAQIPDVHVTLLGSRPAEKVKALESDRVFVPGYIEDVTSYFLNHRVFVAPLRYGAGMKGKIGHSLEYALPLVSTAVGVEGMNLISGRDCIEANTAELFAQAILQLYTDQLKWEYIAGQSGEAIKLYSPQSVKAVVSQLVGSLMEIDTLQKDFLSVY